MAWDERHAKPEELKMTSIPEEDPEDRGVIYSVDDKLVDIGDLRVDEYKKENRLHELPYKGYPLDDVEKVKDIVEEGAGIIEDFKYSDSDSESEESDDESDDEENEDEFIKILKNIQKLNNKSDKNLKKIRKGKKKDSVQDLAKDARGYCSDINNIIDTFVKSF